MDWTRQHRLWHSTLHRLSFSCATGVFDRIAAPGPRIVVLFDTENTVA
jgi:hypothetical protein